MNRFGAWVLGCFFVSLGVLYGVARLCSETTGADGAGLRIIEGPPRHLVTTGMLDATEKMMDVTAPAFRAQASDERFYDVTELAKEGPVALVFIKDGCPCSQAAQPFLNLLFDAYGKHARFFGIFDGSVASAKRWATRNLAPFPLLSDPELRMVREYKAENSAYVALIAKGGTIEKLWPGYSAEMLADAAARLARLTGVVAQPIDIHDAPTEMTTGCPY